MEKINYIPKGWHKIEKLDGTKDGYYWYSNGESRFSGKFKHILVKINK